MGNAGDIPRDELDQFAIQASIGAVVAETTCIEVTKNKVTDQGDGDGEDPDCCISFSVSTGMMSWSYQSPIASTTFVRATW